MIKAIKNFIKNKDMELNLINKHDIEIVPNTLPNNILFKLVCLFKIKATLKRRIESKKKLIKKTKSK